MPKKPTATHNPLIDVVPGGTLDNCIAVLHYVANAKFDVESEIIDYGQFLMLMSVCEALQHTDAAIKPRPTLEVANG